MNSLILQIALSQYGVKELEGEDHNNPTIIQYNKDIGLKGINTDEVPWCLTGDMEVLTCDGFVRFDQFKTTRQVAQVTTDNKVQFVGDFAFIKKRYKGTLYNIRKKSMDISCDPNHEFYGRWSSTGQYKKRKISTVTSYGVAIPPIQSSKEDFPISDRDLKLLGAFLSDGNKQYNRIIVGVSKERKKVALSQLGPEWEKDDNVLYEGKKLRRTYSFVYPEQFHVCLDEYKILNWDFVRSLSARQCKLFIDNYSIYDGTLEQGGYTVFTISERLSESLAYIATMAGYRSSWYKTAQVSENCKAEYLYNVYVSTNNTHKFIQKKNVTESEFDGYMYCLSVPSGVMVIRDRNKNIYPIGNCAVGVSWVLMKAGCDYLSTTWARDYLKYGTEVILTEAQPGDIVVFDRGNGFSHVGFFLGFKNGDNKMFIYGGNQGNAWNINEFPVDKILGIRRSAAAISLSVPSPGLILGSKGDEVKQLQSVLTYMKLYNKSIDGDFGPATVSALISFQSKNKIHTSGIFDKDTYDRMFSIMNG